MLQSGIICFTQEKFILLRMDGKGKLGHNVFMDENVNLLNNTNLKTKFYLDRLYKTTIHLSEVFLKL